MPITLSRPPVPNRPVWLYGFGGHAKVVADLLIACNMKLAGVIDDNQQVIELTENAVRPGLKLGLDPDIFNATEPMVICVGSNRIREKLATQIPNPFVSLWHPSTIVSPTASIGLGTVIMQGSIVQSETTLGNHVIINSGASIDHENRIADFVHVSPNATLCGNVTVGEGAWIGAGAVVIQGVNIGKWAIVGAGAVVIRDVPDYATVVGNPGRVIKLRSADDDDPSFNYDGDGKATFANIMNQELVKKLAIHQTFKKVSEIINQVLLSSMRPTVESIELGMNLQEDLGLDSLELAELTVRIESATGVDVFKDGLVTTVGEVVEKVRRGVGE